MRSPGRTLRGLGPGDLAVARRMSERNSPCDISAADSPGIFLPSARLAPCVRCFRLRGVSLPVPASPTGRSSPEFAASPCRHSGLGLRACWTPHARVTQGGAPLLTAQCRRLRGAAQRLVPPVVTPALAPLPLRARSRLRRGARRGPPSVRVGAVVADVVDAPTRRDAWRGRGARGRGPSMYESSHRWPSCGNPTLNSPL
eukprot:scaffold1108_cov387-Prasinococcus_capsulatus_cf.AAC.4